MAASSFRFVRGDDAELAHALIAKLGPNTTHDDGAFYVYLHASGYWHRLSNERIKSSIADFAGELVLSPTPKLLTMSNARAEGAAQLARAHLLADPRRPQFASAAPGVAFANGFVLVSNGKLDFRPHDPAHLARHGFDFDFVPGAPHPKLSAFLDQIFGDIGQAERAEQVGLCQEFIGTSLIGDAVEYQRCLVFFGTGANVKSSLMEVAEACFPPDAVTAIPPQDWGKTFRLAGLAGARINIVNEMPEHDIVANAVFKSVITGEPLTGEHKYQEAFRFRPRAGHLFSANSLPATNDHSGGFWRRLLVVPFTRDMTALANHRPGAAREVIRAELPAIVGWALEGAARVQRQGGYAEPASSRSMVTQWRTETDSVRLFLGTQCVAQGSIGSTPLYNAYKTWAVENGFRVLTITNFGRRANQAGFKSRHTSVGNVYDVRPKTSAGYMNGVKYSGVQPSARPPGKSGGSGDP